MYNNKNIYKCLFYSTLGDKIGYGNGDLQFNKNYYGIMTKEKNPYDYIELSASACDDIVFNFLADGLLLNVQKIKNYHISYNTKLHLAIADVLVKNSKIDDILINIKNKFIKIYEIDDPNEKKKYSKIFLKQIKNLKNNNYNYLNEKYSIEENSSDPAAISMILGTIFNLKEDFDKLIYLIINIVRLTHNNGIAILGAICSALFTIFTINKVDINKWPNKIIDIFSSDKFKKIYLDNTNSEKNYIRDLDLYIYQWKKYLDIYLDKDGKKKLSLNYNADTPSIKYELYYRHFSDNKNIFYPGDSGDDCMIIVYDCLTDLKNKYKNSFDILICYSVFHTGNSKNIGSIISCLYGLQDIEIKSEYYKLLDNSIEKTIKLISNI